MLLFRVGSGTDWQGAGVTGETITALVVRGLIVRDGRERLMLADDGGAAMVRDGIMQPWKSCFGCRYRQEFLLSYFKRCRNCKSIVGMRRNIPLNN
jgi:hypothetical protein